jgi:plastocyanin
MKAKIFLVLAACGLAAAGCVQVPPAATAQPAVTPTAASAQPAATPEPSPTPFAYATLRASPDATFRALDSTAWQPYSRGIRPAGTITWENWDTSSAHPVECVQGEPAACPWTGRIELPPATAANGTVIPSTASFSGFAPGVYIFRDALHPDMRGEIVVGAPARQPMTPAAP